MLAEEELHLTQMLDRLRELGADPEALVSGFARIEDRLFRSFWATLDRACEALPQAA